METSYRDAALACLEGLEEDSEDYSNRVIEVNDMKNMELWVERALFWQVFGGLASYSGIMARLILSSWFKHSLRASVTCSSKLRAASKNGGFEAFHERYYLTAPIYTWNCLFGNS
ncbi:hypothetical protein B0T10DRAFT_467998 [Thelonectria olida]|uniref:Uncharacterized protein n=1 Tax=Thelonectria olida TaxID=1576542 RepID=A0A9P8VNT3_9HYPO|nr:hypothetical protein B0T10DRAFT_467998 [Thelonectria olida]